MESSARNFQLNDVVLAKVGTYPPWPAKVVDPAVFNKQEKPGETFVLFFFPHQVRHCQPKDLLPFSGEFREAAEARAERDDCEPEFKKALASCLQELAERGPSAPASSGDVDGNKAGLGATTNRTGLSTAARHEKEQDISSQEASSEQDVSLQEASPEPRRSPRVAKQPNEVTSKKVAVVSGKAGETAKAADAKVEEEKSTRKKAKNEMLQDKRKSKAKRDREIGEAEETKDSKAAKLAEDKEKKGIEEIQQPGSGGVVGYSRRQSRQTTSAAKLPEVTSSVHESPASGSKTKAQPTGSKPATTRRQGQKDGVSPTEVEASGEDSQMEDGSSSSGSSSEEEDDEDYSASKKRTTRTTTSRGADRDSPAPAKRSSHTKPASSTEARVKKSSAPGAQGKGKTQRQKRAAEPDTPDAPDTPERQDDEGGKGSLVHAIEKLKSAGKQQILDTAKDWADAWETNPSQAFSHFLFLMLELCGAPVEVTEEELAESDLDIDSVVQRQVVAASKEEVVDLFAAKGKASKKFRSNLDMMLRELVTESQEGLVFATDTSRIDTILDFATALSCSAPRTFRVAATSVALSLISCFLELAISQTEHRETTQRQYNAEQRKAEGSAGKARKARQAGADSAVLQELGKQLQETHARIARLEGLMRKGFTGLMMHRYRDVDPSIREHCMEALGSWIAGYPSLFLQDTYTKYLGWMLNDKAAAVRLAAMEALENLYSREETVPALSQFSDRFVPRMLQMAHDVDDSVAVAALKLIKILLGRKLVKPEDVLGLSQLAVCEVASIRNAVADVLIDAHSALASSSKTSGPDSSGRQKKGGKKSSDASEKELLCAARMLLPHASQPHLCSYIVDALWQKLPALQDWTLICTLLDGTESGSPEPGLAAGSTVTADERMQALALLLSGSVTRAVGGEQGLRLRNADEGQKKEKNSKKEQLKLEEARTELTKALIPHLPGLLQKFSADQEISTLLLRVALQLDLGVFSLKQDDQAFTTILSAAKGVFQRHSHHDALATSAQVLSHFYSGAPSGLSTQARLLAGETVTQLVQGIKESASEALAGASDPSESTCDAVTFTNALERLRCLLTATEWTGLVKAGADRSQGDSEDKGLEDVLLDSLLRLHNGAVRLSLLKTASIAVECMQLLLLWSVVTLNQLPTDRPDPPESGPVAVALERRDAVQECLGGLLPKLLALDPEEAGQDTDVEDERTRLDIIVKVLKVTSDFYVLLAPARARSSVLLPLNTPMTERTLRVYWDACELVLAAPDDTDTGTGKEGEAEGQDNGASAPIRHIKAHVLRDAARLIAMGAAPSAWLSARVLSHFTSHADEACGPAAKRVLQELLQHLRRDVLPSPKAGRGAKAAPAPGDKEGTGAALGRILLNAIKVLFIRQRQAMADDSSLSEDNQEELVEARLIQPCHDLAKGFLAHFTGLSRAALRPLVWAVVTEGAELAFTKCPENVLFLTAGVLPFVSKLLPEDGLELLKVLQSRKEVAIVEDPEKLQPCEALMDFLQERFSKAEPGSAQRTPQPSPARPAAGAEATDPPAAPRSVSVLKRKKLSFQSAVDDVEMTGQAHTEQAPDEAGETRNDFAIEEEGEQGEGEEDVAMGTEDETLASRGESGKKSDGGVFGSAGARSYTRRGKRAQGPLSDGQRGGSGAPSASGATPKEVRGTEQGGASEHATAHHATQGSEDVVPAPRKAKAVIEPQVSEDTGGTADEGDAVATGDEDQSQGQSKGAGAGAAKEVASIAEETEDEGSWMEEDVQEDSRVDAYPDSDDEDGGPRGGPGEEETNDSEDPAIPASFTGTASEEQLPKK